MATRAQICDIPCADGAIQAMVEAMSREGRHGTTICWDDFKAYMTGEFTAGRNMLSGHYILPTGQALPFGLQIKRLKRHQLLDRVMAGGTARDEITKQHEHAMLPEAGQARAMAASCTCSAWATFIAYTTWLCHHAARYRINAAHRICYLSSTYSPAGHRGRRCCHRWRAGRACAPLQEFRARVRVRERVEHKRISLGASVARHSLAALSGVDTIEVAMREHMLTTQMDVRRAPRLRVPQARLSRLRCWPPSAAEARPGQRLS